MLDIRTFDKIKQNGNPPQLPQVLIKLIEAFGRETTGVRELTQIISADPALTSRIMEIIGSSFVNLPEDIQSIESAVVYLGMDTIKNLAISSSAMQVFKADGRVPEFDINKFWLHTYQCGILARKIAQEIDYPNPEEAFIGGLLHDMGRLMLMEYSPEKYSRILKGNSLEKDILQAEQNILGVTTPEISAWLFSKWKLNPLIGDAVLYIHNDMDQVAQALDLVKIIFMADKFSHLADPHDPGELLKLIDIPSALMEGILRDTQDEMAQMADMLGINPKEDLEEEGEVEPVPGPAPLDDLRQKVKEFSIFHGTLENLLNAGDQTEILKATARGLKIVFNIDRIFFFLLDKEKNLLTGHCEKDDIHSKIITSIAIPLANKTSLVTRALTKKEILTSFESSPPLNQAISDVQLTRLMGAEGLCSIPLYAVPDTPMGVILMGIAPHHQERLNENRNLINLFARHAANCLRSHLIQDTHETIVQGNRMEAFTTITHKIIHEINNPSTIVKSYLKILSLKLPDKHPAQAELSVISEEMERISGLIRNLSDFTRPEIDEFSPVDINQLFSSVLEIINQSLLLPKGIKTRTKLDPNVPLIRSDKNSLKQILINLMKNASEALDDKDEIQVVTRFLPGSEKILIDEKRRIPGSIEITIQDNGPGIPDEIRERLFEPYNSSKGAGNSGLGLSIVYSIIKELNGSISCDTPEEGGTAFKILLPVKSARSQN